jgi:hypothetical protein
MLVRLKPFNERKRHLTRTYMFDGVRFFVDRGWYDVADAFADRLRDLRQDYHDPDSPLLFDVCTPKQAEALEQAEVAAEVKATARRPATVVTTRSQEERKQQQSSESGDMTSADVTSPSPAPAMIDPADEDVDAEEEQGRVVEVGRVSKSSPPSSGPKERRKK